MGKIKTIRFLSTATIVAVYLVILAGAVVRMTGSGMGCPDWPKCFGQWIPPTDVSQLPADYESRYLEIRKEKLDKYIALIDAIGMPQVAMAMQNDPSLLETEEFNPVGTWIEYVNRLCGFMSGNFMLALFIASLWWLKRRPLIPIVVFIALVSIVFQAWLGSVVVATNLLPWTITIHMVVAFLIIALLIQVRQSLSEHPTEVPVKLKGVLAISILLTLVQVVLGTQVRQEVDFIARQFADRGEWIAQISGLFEIHRSFSIILVLITGWFIYKNKALWSDWAMKALGGLLAIEVLLGMILAYLEMPRFAQPLHLLVVTLFFGVQCWLLFWPKPGARVLR